MKRRLLLPFLLLSLSLPLVAADEKPAAAPTIDFSNFKTADEAWKQLEKLQQVPTEKPKSQEEAVEQLKKYLKTQQEAADAFIKAFPDDSRSWRARLYALRASMKARQVGIEGSDEEDQKRISEIIDAPAAPAAIKGEAAFTRLMLQGSKLDKDKPEGFTAFQKAIADFLEKYPDHELVSQVKSFQMQALNEDPTPEGTEMLKKLAAGSDARQAEAAKGILERREKLAVLKSKPVELAFTAADGHPFDIANLRGKVVLLDFWASWCGPCMREMPNVVSIYSKLHEKGFEIVGISLDQDKGAMEEAMKQQNMTWTQYFESGDGENKIAKSFGVLTIPSTWLFDKKGLLREQGLRGEELAAAVEKLIAE